MLVNMLTNARDSPSKQKIIWPKMPTMLRLRNPWEENLLDSKSPRPLVENGKEWKEWLVTYNHSCFNNTGRKVVNIKLSVWNHLQIYFDIKSQYAEYEAFVNKNMIPLINVKHPASTVVGYFPSTITMNICNS